MLEYIKNELFSFGIKRVKAIPLSMCRILRKYKLEKSAPINENDLSVIIFAIPYFTENKAKNISSYAIPRDYHLFCRELFSSILPKLEKAFPENRFWGFSDDSPINERHAAALSGLGILGDNGLIITEEYSSYIFLAEIITDLSIKHQENYEIKRCEGCGRCSAACPKREIGDCLSAITQKKGELSENEQNAILKYGCVWGCDICSEVCPHTISAIQNRTIYTSIPFFNYDTISTLDTQLVLDMSDSDFSCRAYSWRGKAPLLRNLNITETKTRK